MGGFLSNAVTGPLNSGDELSASEDPVMREVSVLRMEEDGPCGERPQCLYFV
jgi:hypothetical protein